LSDVVYVKLLYVPQEQDLPVLVAQLGDAPTELRTLIQSVDEAGSKSVAEFFVATSSCHLENGGCGRLPPVVVSDETVGYFAP
jgi:hypothetical protein